MKIMTFGKLMLKILIVLLDFKISSNKNCICFSLIKNGSALRIDLANGSGQSGSVLTHAGSSQMGSGNKKTGRAKWVAQPMTLT